MFDLEKITKEIELQVIKDDIRKALENKYMLAALEQFNKANKINQQPPKKMLNRENGFLTLPISWVEAKLRSIFLGKVKFHSFFYTVIGNEITGTITIECFHPVTREWLQYVGAASKFIQQRKTSDGKKTPLDQWETYKFPNGIEKTLPALKSMCVKNAAKQIGKCFGSDLNRKEDKTSEENNVLEPHTQVAVFKAIKAAHRDVAAINNIVNEMPHAAKYSTCVGMIKVARALAQCSNTGEMSKLATERGWIGKYDNIINLYK